MTLQRFLLGVGESRWFWWGVRRWKPAAAQRWSAAAMFVHVARLGLVAALVGGALTLLSWQTSFRGSWWPMRWVFGLAAVMATVMLTMLAVAWNRRARAVAHGRAIPGEPLPPLRVWQRWLLGPLYALVFFVATPFYLWFSLGNAAGAWAWERARAAMIARGTPLEMSQLLSPAPPNDENLAQTPLLRPLLEYRLESTGRSTEAVWSDRAGYLRAQAFVYLPSPIAASRERVKRADRPPTDGRYDLLALARGIRAQPVRVEFPGLPVEVSGGPVSGRRVPSSSSELPPDMLRRFGIDPQAKPALSSDQARALVIEDPAGEVLRYLERYTPEMSELSTAARRPRSQFPAHWEDGSLVLLTHLAPLRGASTLFRVRAAARLAKGDPAGAHADTLTALRLGQALAEDPLLLSHLVYVAQQSTALATVWEGLISHQWTDAQIAELQEWVSRFNPRESLRFAYQGERIYGNATLEEMLRDPRAFTLRGIAAADGSNAPQPSESPGGYLPGFRPIGLLRHNQIACNRLYDVLLDEVQDPAWPANLVTPRPDAKRDDEQILVRAGLRPTHPDNVLAAMLGPAVTRAQTKTARLGAAARLAETACALERYRLRNGKYPETLEALVPRELRTIPQDPMNHQPLKYEQTNDGWFRLWSVGLDGRDDGGVMSEDPDKTAGDWVWPSPVPSRERRLF